MSTETVDQGAATTAPENDWQAVDPTQMGRGLYTEKITIDPKADAFAIAPPIDDGKYVFALSPSDDAKVPVLQFKTYPAKGDRPEQKVIRVNAVLTIVETADGRPADVLKGKVKKFTKGFSTMNRTDGTGLQTNEVASLLTLLGVDLSNFAQTDSETLAATLAQILSTGQARIGDRTSWKTGFVRDDKNPKDYGKWLLQGQKNFPLAANGKPGEGPYNPVVNINGTEYRAKAYLSGRFFSLSTLKA